MSHVRLVSVPRSLVRERVKKQPDTELRDILCQFGVSVIIFAQMPERILPCNFPRLPNNYVPVGLDYNGLTTSDPVYIDAYVQYGKGSYRQQPLLVMKEYDQLDDGLVILTVPARMIMFD